MHCLLFRYKGLVFYRNNGLLMEKLNQGTYSTKMGADKLTENTPNAPKFIRLNCLSKPNSLGF